MPGLLELSPAELEGHFDEPFRAGQVLGWLARGVVDYSRMSDLPRPLRQKLARELPLFSMGLEGAVDSSDGLTTKLLIRTSDGHLVESVLIRARRRRTVCVSTQIGCPVGCVFCASGKGGLVRSLSAGEMVEQVVHANARERVTNVVFMGIGEPLLNVRSLIKAIRGLADPRFLGLGARRMTVSTVGVRRGLRALAGVGMQVGLAVSLHAPDDKTRARVVPRMRMPVRELLEEALAYGRSTRARLTCEYVLVDGLNSSPEDARGLASMLQKTPFKVNLIPLNPVEGVPWRAPPRKSCIEFRKELVRRGVRATVRAPRGRDASAACGQLRASLD